MHGHDEDEPMPLKVGDYVRWFVSHRCWCEGEVVSLCNEHGHHVMRQERQAGTHNINGLFSFRPGDRSISRAPRPEAHRDIKPENATAAKVKVTGYGVASFTVTRAELVAATKHDGTTGAQCLYQFERNQQIEPGQPRYVLSPAQLSAARELWSAQLRALQARALERERCRVVVDLWDGDE